MKILIQILILISSLTAMAQPELNKGKRIYVVDIKDEIGPKVWRETKRAFDEAHKEGADAIVIDMNTYGGMVIFADSLRSLILNESLPVWVYINNNAASAGALISIACDKIYMTEGANIGAATVVNQTGEAMPDKYQSYMRSMIRSTAQAHGADTIVENGKEVIKWKRDPHIAEAMVDERININGVTDSGRIVTFTSHEAVKHGFCDGIVGSMDELLVREHYVPATQLRYEKSTMDKIIGFLINPVLQGILIMIIIGGIYFELQTPGIGFPIIASITACLLYFAPLYLEGIANNWEIIVFGVGVILLMLEIFVIPGFGVAGILGIGCILGALIMAPIDGVSFEYFDDIASAILRSFAIVVGSATGGLVLGIILAKRVVTARSLPFALHSEQRVEDGYVSVDMRLKHMVGSQGVTITDLRPSGKIKLHSEIYDAVAIQGDYIPLGTFVKVRQFQSGQLYVERVEA
ncbi:MAG: NfeD family protein [Marinifilaceae bacterium]